MSDNIHTSLRITFNFPQPPLNLRWASAESPLGNLGQTKVMKMQRTLTAQYECCYCSQLTNSWPYSINIFLCRISSHAEDVKGLKISHWQYLFYQQSIHFPFCIQSPPTLCIFQQLLHSSFFDFAKRSYLRWLSNSSCLYLHQFCQVCSWQP